MICNRMEDYLSCHHSHPYRLDGCPCCDNCLPKIPTYENTKRDIYIQTNWTAITYNSVFLSIWVFSSLSPTCNFDHTRPSILGMNGRPSPTPSVFVYTEYQQASGPSAEARPPRSFAGCYAGTVPVCFETKLMSCVFLISLLNI